MANSIICSTCGEPNNPTFSNCYKCANALEKGQAKSANGIPILTFEAFMTATFGGRPNTFGMKDYEGSPFQCVCGKPHNYTAKEIEVLRELQHMRLVLACPDDKGVNCVKVKGLFKFKGFETIFGALNSSENS